MWKPTPRSAMANSDISSTFAFISIDSRNSQVDHLNAPGLSAPNSGASLSRQTHPNKLETPWEPPLPQFAFVMTSTPG